MPTFDELNEMEYYNTGIGAIKFEATRFYFSSDFFDSQPFAVVVCIKEKIIP